MIYVVDAMMGTGKTSAAINYMNEHGDEYRFLFVTPYLTECERVMRECPRLNFAEPSNNDKDTNYRKLDDLKRLITEKRNIATSHELYSRITPEMADMIGENHYVMFIDEVVDVFREPDTDPCDIDVLAESGYIVPDTEMSTADYSVYRRSGKEYFGKLYKEIYDFIDSRRLVGVNDAPVNLKYYCWMLNRKLFDAAVDTYVLTYLFEGSGMYGYLRMNHIDYKSIGVIKTASGYRFSDECSIPEMAPHIRDYLVVLEHKRLNAIGEPPGALSKSWYERDEQGDRSGIDTLRKHLTNYYQSICKTPAKYRMWTTFASYDTEIRKGKARGGFVSWNKRATNEFSDKTTLAFLVNVYAKTALVQYMNSSGIEFDQRNYALSSLVQWIWRSAIRRGEKVHLYLPSSRMRKLLNAWMDDLESGGDGSGFVDRLA